MYCRIETTIAIPIYKVLPYFVIMCVQKASFSLAMYGKSSFGVQRDWELCQKRMLATSGPQKFINRWKYVQDHSKKSVLTSETMSATQK